MVNLTYGLWMLASNLMQLLQCMALDMAVRVSDDDRADGAGAAARADKAAKRVEQEEHRDRSSPAVTSSPPSLIIEAINKNSLPFFLLVSTRSRTRAHHIASCWRTSGVRRGKHISSQLSL